MIQRNPRQHYVYSEGSYCHWMIRLFLLGRLTFQSWDNSLGTLTRNKRRIWKWVVITTAVSGSSDGLNNMPTMTLFYRTRRFESPIVTLTNWHAAAIPEEAVLRFVQIWEAGDKRRSRRVGVSERCTGKFWRRGSSIGPVGGESRVQCESHSCHAHWRDGGDWRQWAEDPLP